MAGKTAAAGTQPGSNLRIKVDAAAAAAEKAASGESRAVEHVAELHPSQVPAWRAIAWYSRRVIAFAGAPRCGACC